MYHMTEVYCVVAQLRAAKAFLCCEMFGNGNAHVSFFVAMLLSISARVEVLLYGCVCQVVLLLDCALERTWPDTIHGKALIRVEESNSAMAYGQYVRRRQTCIAAQTPQR